MTPELRKLLDRLLAGESNALARTLSLLESNQTLSPQIAAALFPHSGKSSVIGITGSPGVGKSTLVDALAAGLAAVPGNKVGIIAIDPTSPFSGGALLGDRIRMNRASVLPGVFIRSMATRGALGGLSPRTNEAVTAFEAAGYSHIILETVGVGQAEVEIIRTADCVVVVLVPGMGDGVQALKAGIIEIADVFAINKADYEGVERLEKELLTVLSLGTGKKPEIVRTIATSSEGAEKLTQAISAFIAAEKASGGWKQRRESGLYEAFRKALSEESAALLLEFANRTGTLESLKTAIVERSCDPVSAARMLLQQRGLLDS